MSGIISEKVTVSNISSARSNEENLFFMSSIAVRAESGELRFQGIEVEGRVEDASPAGSTSSPKVKSFPLGDDRRNPVRETAKGIVASEISTHELIYEIITANPARGQALSIKPAETLHRYTAWL